MRYNNTHCGDDMFWGEMGITMLFTRSRSICENGVKWYLVIYYTGLKTDVGNREVKRENKAVCGKTLMNSQKLNGESTRNILLNEDVLANRTGHSLG